MDRRSESQDAATQGTAVTPVGAGATDVERPCSVVYFGPDGALEPQERFADVWTALAAIGLRWPETELARWRMVAEVAGAVGGFECRLPLTVNGSDGVWYAVLGRDGATPEVRKAWRHEVLTSIAAAPSLDVLLTLLTGPAAGALSAMDLALLPSFGGEVPEMDADGASLPLSWDPARVLILDVVTGGCTLVPRR